MQEMEEQNEEFVCSSESFSFDVKVETNQNMVRPIGNVFGLVCCNQNLIFQLYTICIIMPWFCLYWRARKSTLVVSIYFHFLLQLYRDIQRALAGYKDEKRGPTMLLIQSHLGELSFVYVFNSYLMFHRNDVDVFAIQFNWHRFVSIKFSLCLHFFLLFQLYVISWFYF